MNTKNVRITFRGYPGHFCGAHRCLFRLNTLVEYNEKAIVVSTVGLYCLDFNVEPLVFEYLDASKNYFETKAFWSYKDKFRDANVKREIYYDTSLPRYKKFDMELKANEGHYKVIEEISQKLLSGDL